MIHLLGPEDINAYYTVVHESYREDLALGINFTAGNATKEELTLWLKENPTYGLFADSGELISTISLRMPWSSNPGPCICPHIGKVSTLPKYKHQGYSHKLFSWLEENILKQALKTPKVTLGTAQEHPWLVKMYEKWGFTSFAAKQLPGKNYHTVYLHKLYEYD